MWSYLTLMIHVREKDPTEYNGWETYVAAKMKDKDTSFMPRNTALVLQAHKAEDEAAVEELKRRMDAFEGQQRQMLTILEAMQKAESGKKEEGSQRGSTAQLARAGSTAGAPADSG